MKKILLIYILFIFGCATINDMSKVDKSIAFFYIGMPEDEFIRKNPDITEQTHKSDGYSIYIESEPKYRYIWGKAIPQAFEEYMFEFKNDTLIAVYRGRNNYNREIDYSKYPNSKPK